MKKFLSISLFSISLYGMNTEVAPSVLKLSDFRRQISPQSSNSLKQIEDCSFDTPSSSRLLSNELANQVMNAAPEIVKEVLANLLNDELSAEHKPKRLLLVGEPGTGKSKIALAMMTILSEQGWKHKFFESALIGNEYRNSASQNLNRIMESLSCTKSVITFDEISCLVDEQEKNDQQVISTATSLWQIFDRCDMNDNVFIIGTTNNIKKLPPAFKSRFEEEDMLVEVPLPELSKRAEIIKYYLGSHTENFTSKNIITIARYLEKKSCRDIEGIVKRGIRKSASQKKNISYDLLIEIVKARKGSTISWKSIKDKIIIIIKNTIPYAMNLSGLALSFYLSEKQTKHNFDMMLESQSFQLDQATKQIVNQLEMQEKNQQFQSNLAQEQIKSNQNFQLYMYEKQKNDNESWSWHSFFEGMGKICAQALISGAVQAASNKYCQNKS